MTLLAGPSDEQLDRLEQLREEEDCDVVLAEWLAGSGDVEADCLRAGRRSARFRIYPDGRAVEERTWQ